MKLRVRGNSLRLRLTRTEVAGLTASGFVENRAQLGAAPDCVFAYRIETSDTATRPTIAFHNSRLCVQLPAKAASDWAQSERVGIYSEEAWGLKLAIEKDFKCLDPRLDEDESDSFENPNTGGHTPCPSD